MKTAQDILHNYSDDLDSRVVVELQLMISRLQGALGTGEQEQVSSAFKALSSVLGPLQGFTPFIELSIEIECPSQVTVGHILECSSSHGMVPDQVTWHAPGGVPSSGNDSWLQTYFYSTGSFSISIEACIDSVCDADVQGITVIPEPPPARGTIPPHSNE